MLHKNITTLLNITLAVCEAKDLQYFSSGFCLNQLKITLKDPPRVAENPAVHLKEKYKQRVWNKFLSIKPTALVKP